MADLLIELFSEEIPARMQAGACDALKRLVTDGLVERGLTYGHAQAFATPRRLALAVQGLSDHSPTTREERRGPKVGAPEKAVEGFLRSTGVTLEDLEIRDDKKGQVYIANVVTEGRAASAIVAEVLEGAIRNFPWPKSMRWGEGSLRWVRPLHSILCILSTEAGADVVPLDVDGIVSGDRTRGHRFMAPDEFSVVNVEDYAEKLKRAKVILDPVERADHIWNDASQMAFAAGLDLVEDRGLLTEVAGLVEWPVVLMGRIDAQFLGLPPEVLQTSMKEHQKFFSLRDPKSGQITGFVTVANRETVDDGVTILAGNQKVLAARLSDAKFFWDNDLRMVADAGLEGMGAGLKDVTFHNKLGSQAGRIARIEALAREIAPLVGADADLAAQAARVVKADLRSEMVGEFPELQGLMGSYYARAAGLPEDVARACVEHYQPLGPSDSVPSSPVSVAVALADKIDTLTGFWAIDEKPTGSKDPYALRRAALGVIRLVLGNEVRIGLSDLLKLQMNQQHLQGTQPNHKDFMGICKHIAAILHKDDQEIEVVARRILRGNYDSVSDVRKSFKESLENLVGQELSSNIWDEFIAKSIYFQFLENQLFRTPDLLAFFHDRLKVHLREQGIRHDVIDACLAMPGNDDLTLLVKRAEALAAFLKTEDGGNLLQGFKRANNILTQAEAKDGVEYSFGPDPKLAEDGAERALFAALDQAEAAITPAMGAEDFATAMQAMASLRAPIDAFFDAVQINADNQILRRNRLNLLHRIRATCLQVADLTRVEG
ncbi:glycine--tRNA ligase subunit beta [Roseinatronobacter alkalisoli]|uniref:Glycine--tRNA ligase beta subunit n=1 Tax=Roseinatronobacter alkalisoli TaxID=3028235 RepID=A0ABT5TBL9_9RHOB|nr:glycine--tRNA ligase subunit beta [Roseinatronobacter sp. HJB301]MDD7971776.1 glycine--tRNA ligase subunit beta [Roseinatronobacter sp. HJB301]